MATAEAPRMNIRHVFIHVVNEKCNCPLELTFNSNVEFAVFQKFRLRPGQKTINFAIRYVEGENVNVIVSYQDKILKHQIRGQGPPSAIRKVAKIKINFVEPESSEPNEPNESND